MKCAGLLLLILVGCAPSADLEIQRQFEDAQRAFDRAETPEDFRVAAAAYQDILDRGFVSGIVLYNQGNAFMRAGEPGRAVASYRRAQRYLPREARLQSNLDIAKGGEAEKPGGLSSQLLFWQNRLSPHEKLWIAAALWIVTFTLALLAIWRRRRSLVLPSWIALELAVVLSGSSAWDWFRFERTEHGVLVEDEVVARKGNGVSYQPAFKEPLPETTEFTVLEKQNGWLHIRLEGHLEAWVEEDAVVTY
ncbi:MAG: hypothetical protein RL885_32745 [Planctomycetota bacterium]